MMDNVKYFQSILNASRYAIICFDLNFTVTFWNEQATSLFSWDESIKGKRNPLLLDEELLAKVKESPVPLSTVISLSHEDNPLKISTKGYANALLDESGNLQGISVFLEEIGPSTKKRTFNDIRTLILSSLLQKRKTINQIGKDIDVNWKTVEKHLTYLSGKKYITEVFSSTYVRIFEISPKGKTFIETQKKKFLTEHNEHSQSVMPTEDVQSDTPSLKEVYR